MQKLQVPHADVFKAVSDQTRIRILRLLALAGNEMCSCELVDSLLEPEYKISRHLKILKSAGLITAVKDGKWVYHGLNHDEKYQTLLQQTVIELPDHKAQFKNDLLRLKKRMKLRSEGRCVTGAQFQNEQSEKSI